MAVAAEPAIFTRAWRDPASYWFGRLTYELVGAALQNVDPPAGAMQRLSALGGPSLAAVGLHLADFKRWILSIDALTAADRRFASPLRARLPVSLPGTRWSIVGEGEIDLLGALGGRPIVRAGGDEFALPWPAAPAAPDALQAPVDPARRSPRLVCCPAVRAGSGEIRLEPEALQLAGLAFGAECADVEPGFQERHAAIVVEALRWIGRVQPAVLEQLGDSLEVIALKAPSGGTFSNATSSELPGAMILSAARDPLLLADSIVHEIHHGRLFDIEEHGAFFSNDASEWLSRSDLYSPWRDDLRPLHGILHGAYVYLAVLRFWLAALEAGGLDDFHRDFALDQTARIPLQVRLGLAQVEGRGELAPGGRALVAELRAELERTTGRARALDLPEDPPAVDLAAADLPPDAGEGRHTAEARAGERGLSVRAAVARHLALHDRAGQCRDLAVQLDLPVA